MEDLGEEGNREILAKGARFETNLEMRRYSDSRSQHGSSSPHLLPPRDGRWARRVSGAQVLREVRSLKRHKRKKVRTSVDSWSIGLAVGILADWRMDHSRAARFRRGHICGRWLRGCIGTCRA